MGRGKEGEVVGFHLEKVIIIILIVTTSTGLNFLFIHLELCSRVGIFKISKASLSNSTFYYRMKESDGWAVK